VRKQKTITAWDAWLGFVRKADSKFCWIDDTPLARGYTAWASGELNNSNGNENCGNMFGISSGVKWNDLWCDLNPVQLKNAPVIL